MKKKIIHAQEWLAYRETRNKPVCDLQFDMKLFFYNQ